MNLNNVFLFLVLCIGFTACKPKQKVDPKPDTGRSDLSRDSIYLYAKEIYLWSDALPTYDAFNPRKYTTASSDLLNYEKELIALTQFKINPATGLPYEYFASGTDSKYSYIIDKADENPIAFVPTERSSVDLEGNGDDFGVKLGAYGQGGTTFALFVTAVFQNSPADKAGIIRSDRIYKVNGRAIGDNSDVDLPIINAAFFNGTAPITIEGVHYANGSAGAPFTIQLNKAVYKSTPVLAKKIFTVGAKKVGYLNFARFSNLPSNAKADLDAAFVAFDAGNVTDLIIDLRYNGGGYVNTAQYLINQIAPASTSGKVMFSEHYNPLMQAGSANILGNQPYTDGTGKIVYENGRMLTLKDVDYSIVGNTERFLKSGPLNTANTITKVVFIVSGNTASASELVINSLKPYMTVKLVGSKTYGKPVGFFPITIENKYKVFYSLFQTKNSLGQGDYFDGMTPDIVDNFDDPRNNFGDPNEHYTAIAINEIEPNGVVTNSISKTMAIQGKNISVESLKPMKSLAGGNEFIGMIENRAKLKR